MQRSRGLFSGRSRHLARHNRPSKMTISEQIKRFESGDKVVVVPKGNFRDIPHPRYRGRIGRVLGRQGDAYIVEIGVSKSVRKKLVVPEAYLERAKQ